ncbi:putative oxidoreductase DltE [Talaromyces pinophilus]|nr:putative oxidoreductase DltE [Talaromyces pinophilus]
MASFQTILIIGATSGIGEELARQYHSLGKQVIISGRRTTRLDTLAAQLLGVGVIQIDVQDLDALPRKIDEAFTMFPEIDAVIVNAGIQILLDYTADNNSNNNGYPTTANITKEITTNLTGPTVLARCIIEHFRASRPSQASLLAFVTSGLGLVPATMLPIYCATKSALHYFTVILRNQLKDTPISVVEILPPYVKTELDVAHADEMAKRLGGQKPQVMPVKEYVESVIKGLAVTQADGKIQKYVAEGLPRVAVEAWVQALGPIAQMLHMDL